MHFLQESLGFHLPKFTLFWRDMRIPCIPANGTRFSRTQSKRSERSTVG